MLFHHDRSSWCGRPHHEEHQYVHTCVLQRSLFVLARDWREASLEDSINTNSRKVGMTLEIGRRRRGERRNEYEEKEG